MKISFVRRLRRHGRWRLPVTVLLLVGMSAGLVAQRRFFGAPRDAAIDPAPPYDGRFTFARLKFDTAPGGYYYGGLPAWGDGYIPIPEGPRAENALLQI